MSGNLSLACARGSEENYTPFWQNWANQSLTEDVGSLRKTGNARKRSKEERRAFTSAAMSIADSRSPE